MAADKADHSQQEHTILPIADAISRAELLDRLPVPDRELLRVAQAQVQVRWTRTPLGSAQAEEIALLARLKPALRQQLSPDHIAAKRAYFEDRGLLVRETVIGVSHENPDRDALAGRALLVARDPERLERMAHFEEVQRSYTDAGLDADDDIHGAIRDAVAGMGSALGYPPCCVDAFSGEIAARGPGELFGARAALTRTQGTLHARTNAMDRGIFHYLPWTPCAFDCARSLAYADALAARIRPHAEVFLKRVDDLLGATRLALLGDVQVSLRGTVRGDVTEVDEVWPTARDRVAPGVLAPAAAEAVARLVALIRLHRTVRHGEGFIDLGAGAVRIEAPEAAIFHFRAPQPH